MLINIWRYNGITGYWTLVRDSYPENVQRWLEIFRGDEPDCAFRAQRTRPRTPPKAKEAECT